MYVTPMLAKSGGKPFTSENWLYEIKFDGYRALAYVEGGEVVLRTKNGLDATSWWPEVARGLATLPGGPHVLDGEMCCLDDLGRSDFHKLKERSSRQRWYQGCHPCTFMAFDLPICDGRDVRDLPLQERKRLLRDLLQRSAPRAVLYVQDLPAEASLYAKFVLPLQLEGFVAKRLSSRYRGERSMDWVKIKRPGAVEPGRFPRRAR